MFKQKSSLSEEVYKGSVILDKFIHQILLSNFKNPIHVSYYDDKGQYVPAEDKHRVTTIFYVDTGDYSEGRRIDNGSNDIIVEVAYDDYTTELKSKTLADIVTCYITLNPLTTRDKLWEWQPDYEILISRGLTLKESPDVKSCTYNYFQYVQSLKLLLSKLIKTHYEALADMPALDLGN